MVDQDLSYYLMYLSYFSIKKEKHFVVLCRPVSISAYIKPDVAMAAAALVIGPPIRFIYTLPQQASRSGAKSGRTLHFLLFSTADGRQAVLPHLNYYLGCGA